jgi:hypothetical protein
MVYTQSFYGTADPSSVYAASLGLSQVPSPLGSLELAIVNKEVESNVTAKMINPIDSE